MPEAGVAGDEATADLGVASVRGSKRASKDEHLEPKLGQYSM